MSANKDGKIAEYPHLEISVSSNAESSTELVDLLLPQSTFNESENQITSFKDKNQLFLRAPVPFSDNQQDLEKLVSTGGVKSNLLELLNQPQERRRARKTNPKDVSVSTRIYSQFTPTESHSIPETKEEISNSLLGLKAFSGGDSLDSIRPINIPSSVPRYWDTERLVPTLNPKNVAFKLSNSGTKLGQNSSFATLNIFAANKEQFSKVLLSSSITKELKEKNERICKSGNLSAFKFDEDKRKIPEVDFIIPKNTLVVRHPVFKFDQDSQIDCIFPFEKEIENGKLERAILRAALIRNPKKQVAIFTETTDSESNLQGVRSEDMDQHNQYSLNNCHTVEFDALHSEPSNIQYQCTFPSDAILNQLNGSGYSDQQGTTFLITSSPDGSVRLENVMQISPGRYMFSYPNPNGLPINFIHPHQNRILAAPVETLNNNINNTTVQVDTNTYSTPVNVNSVQVDQVLPQPTTKTKAKISKVKAPRKPKATKTKSKIQVPVQYTPPNASNSVEPTVIQNTITSTLVNGASPPVTHHSNHIQKSAEDSSNKFTPNSIQISRESHSDISNNCSVPNHSRNDTINKSTPQLTTTTNTVVPPQITGTNNTSNNNSLPTVAEPILKTIPPQEPEETTQECEERLGRKRYIQGFMTICSHCGICSTDLHHCDRCKSKIPREAKIIADTWNTKKPDTPITSSASAVTKQETLKRTPVKKPKAATTRKSRGGGKRQEECIVLSSDDDEGEEPKAKILKVENQSPCNSPTKSPHGVMKKLQINLTPVKIPKANPPTNNPPHRQGPFYNYVDGTGPILEEPDTDPDEVVKKIEAMMKTSISSGSFTRIECRSIRVGDYKCVALPSQKPNYTVVFSKMGIMFSIPHSQTKKLVQCCVPCDRLFDITSHFRHRLPVVFITTGEKYCKLLRAKLGISEHPNSSPFFCSRDGGTCQRQITFLAEHFSDLDVAAIKQTFYTGMQELDYVRANELLMKITPECYEPGRGIKSTINIPKTTESTTISTTQATLSSTSTTASIVVSQPVINSQVEAAPPDVDVSGNKTLLSYKGIAILQQDILCLAAEQFLNDSILDFWMRYIEQEVLTPEERSRTYMFSTFFYKRLTTKPRKRNGGNEDDPTLSSAEKRHARVKRWTKNVDIFEKDFIIIPINENCHWFMAVICYPGLKGIHNLETNMPIPDYKKPRVSKAKTKGPLKMTEGSDGDIMFNGDSAGASEQREVPNLDFIQNVNSFKEAKSNALRIKQPCILILDSLAGEPRNRVYSTLREYLRVEHKTRKGEDREFTKASMPGSMPRVPQQPNHCDCGIFALYYVECFFQKPIPSFEFPIEECLWRNLQWEGKREEIFKCIKSLVEKNHPDCVPLIPNITFTLPPVVVSSKPKSIDQIKDQIESAPVEKLENVKAEEEPMDVDVDEANSSSSHCNGDTTLVVGHQQLKRTVVEMTRASPTDNDHDHDYTPIPLRKRI